MRVRVLLFACVLATTAVLGTVAGGASAATLWTTNSHLTRVTTGATAVMTVTNLDFTSGAAAVINHCSDAVFNLTLSQNTDAIVVFELTGGSFTCNNTVTGTVPWTLTVSGTGTVSGTNTCWNAAIDRVAFHMFGGLYSGNVTAGATMCQSTSGGAPISLVLASARTWTGPLTGDGRWDGVGTMTGTAANDSFSN